MDINIITRHFDRSQELIALAQRRAAFAFSRFGELVRGIDIRLSDTNGPRGGNGIACVARLRLARGGEVVVESMAVSPEDGVTQAMSRLANRLRRVLSRLHDHR